MVITSLVPARSTGRQARHSHRPVARFTQETAILRYCTSGPHGIGPGRIRRGSTGV